MHVEAEKGEEETWVLLLEELQKGNARSVAYGVFFDEVLEVVEEHEGKAGQGESQGEELQEEKSQVVLVLNFVFD